MIAPRTAARAHRQGGFTLLEITVAMAIFFLIVMFAYTTMMDAVDESMTAERARELRMLAELKLGEIAVFERHHDENWPEEEFSDLPDDLAELYAGWTWRLDVEDGTFFGTQTDPNAPYFFEDAAGADAAGADAAQDGAAAGAVPDAPKGKGKEQVLRKLVLTVSAPGDDGGTGDSIEIVTFLPQVAVPTAATPAGGGK